MIANSFRRIALARGLLPAEPLWPPPGSEPLWGTRPEAEPEPAERAAETCEECEDVA